MAQSCAPPRLGSPCPAPLSPPPLGPQSAPSPCSSSPSGPFSHNTLTSWTRLLSWSPGFGIFHKTVHHKTFLHYNINVFQHKKGHLLIICISPTLMTTVIVSAGAYDITERVLLCDLYFWKKGTSWSFLRSLYVFFCNAFNLFSRRAPPGKCKQKPVPVKTKSKHVPFVPLASKSLVFILLWHNLIQSQRDLWQFLKPKH